MNKLYKRRILKSVLIILIFLSVLSKVAIGEIRFQTSTIYFFSNNSFWYNGYGIKAGTDKIELGYAKITYYSREPSNLLNVRIDNSSIIFGGRGVYSKPGKLLTLTLKLIDQGNWELWSGLQYLTTYDTTRNSMIIIIGRRLEYLFVNLAYVDGKIGFCIDFNIPIIMRKFDEQILRGKGE